MKRRMIDPDFFTDSLIISTLDYPGRLFYAGLWVVAEDSGVFEPNSFGLKMKLFPGDTIDVEDVKSYYEKLVMLGKVIQYENNGRTYAWLRNFFKHQKLERPNPPVLPLPACLRWHGKEEFGDTRRSWHYELTAQCPPHDGTMTAKGRHDDGTMTAVCCPCAALKEVKGSKGKGSKRSGKEVKEKGTRASEAEQQQPGPPVKEASRLSSLNEANRRRETATNLLLKRTMGEITQEEYDEQTKELEGATG